MTLFPVILPVIEDLDKLPGKDKVALLSRVARQALKFSAERSGVILGELSKDEDDAPLPSGNHYWSVSHKPKFVAAVVSNGRIGIDIEEMKPRAESMFSYVASDEEWELSRRKSWETFFRYWTAKEAVLKADGIGLGGLKTCRIISVLDEAHIHLDYRERLYQVEQLRYNNHIISILKDDNEVEWITPGALRSSRYAVPVMI